MSVFASVVQVGDIDFAADVINRDKIRICNLEDGQRIEIPLKDVNQVLRAIRRTRYRIAQ